MAFRYLLSVLLISAIVSDLRSEDDLKDFDFVGSDSDEVMIAQESRHYQTFVKPPVRIVKPIGVTNSHRPQYNLDSLEDGLADIEEFLETTTRRTLAYKPSYKVRSKESMIKDAVLRALERKDHVGKFAQILPIIRAMSGSQRVALASLVASQVTTPPGRAPLNLAQVRSMFGNNNNTTTDLMLPILLDTANLIRRAVRPGKQVREVIMPPSPQAQMLRRSFNEDDTYFEDDTDTEDVKDNDNPNEQNTDEHDDNKTVEHTENQVTERETKPTIYYIKTTTATPTSLAQRLRSRRIIQRASQVRRVVDQLQQDQNKTTVNDTILTDNITVTADIQNEDNNSNPATTESIVIRGRSAFRSGSNSSNVDLTADATNQTLAQDLPLPEKLRSMNRYVDRKGIRRGPPPKPITRRTTAEPTLSSIARRRPTPPRKLSTTVATEPQTKCELFTNTLCLHTDDYPTDAIVQSIRRNKAAAGALLADFRDPGEGAVDGVSADQEAKYTADYYLISNRRGDTANRDFASAGEAGFMCPSTVKYARPQRARATSGQWKYIVNTGEHTQTLRLEKCLKPKESCTYLTDNFKSKCVQVYNYHRLLTWDQQNGLHMDIFKVPTCCSCHIEGYSVSFPPLGHRVHETTSAEQFPAGEDISSEHGNQAFESVQPSIHRPSVSISPPFTHGKPLETFPPFSDNHNLISGIGFSKSKRNENDDANSQHVSHSHPIDSYGNTYFPDSFDQPSSIRNVKRPSSGRLPVISSASQNFDSATLPSYLEPPTPVGPNSFTFIKETPSKYKITGSKFKRGPVIRPKRRPIRKKISTGPEDLISSGTAALESYSNPNYETMEEFNDDVEEPDVGQASLPSTPKRVTIAPKLQTVTTETPVSTTFQLEENNPGQENYNSEEIRINYNYHPIIDFFGESDKEPNNDSIDREDIEASLVPTVQSEWKPISNLPPRNTRKNIN